MAKTYEPIATYTLPSSQATVSFTSIPGTYTDIVAVLSLKQTGTPTGTDAFFQINAAVTGYSGTFLRGNGSTATSTRITNADRGYFQGSPLTTNFTNVIYNFMNYSNTTTYKTILMKFAEGADAVYAATYLYRNTAAITTISFTSSDQFGAGSPDYWTAGSTFTLYGIKAA